MDTSPRGQDTRFADLLEQAAGYHPPAPRSVYTLFGHCATAEGHARCPEYLEARPTAYACSCPCHRPPAWDEGQGDYDATFWGVSS